MRAPLRINAHEYVPGHQPHRLELTGRVGHTGGVEMDLLLHSRPACWLVRHRLYVSLHSMPPAVQAPICSPFCLLTSPCPS